MKRRLWSLLPLVPVVVLAGDSPREQQELARRLGEKVQRFEMRVDHDENVTGLIFINHQALTESVGEKPGIDDSDLAELTRFPKLTAVNIEAQPISDEGLQVLRQIPGMKQVGFHYMAKAEGAAASPDFITTIDEMRDLEILEIKHNFRMPAIRVEKLQGPFPKVWRLVLDTPLSREQTMHLIRLCPNVTDLQLHRTEVSADQLAEIGRLLPRLEVLWLKPKRGLTVAHLNSLENFPKLSIFSPQHFQDELPYKGGWDSLTRLAELTRLEIAGTAAAANRAALDRLQQQCPNLVIDPELTRSRNYDGL